MKEYESKSGGRYVFNEDFQNLQELALSMTSLYDDFNTNFVISGCVISKSNGVVSVSSGFVYLDGKIRSVSAKQGSDSNNIGVHIVAKNTDGASIVYADGTSKKQYTDYGTEVRIGAPVSSGEVVISVSGDVSGKQFPNLRDAWFRHYAVTKDINGIVDLIKLLANGCEIAGDTGNTDDFRGTYINSYSGIPANTPVSGMSLNDVPIFTYNDLMLIKKLIVQDLFVKGNAYINELFVNNAHIPNTVRVLASAKMKASDGSTTINNMVAYVTNFELIIAGTCTAANLGLSSGSAVGSDAVAKLYLPSSILNAIKNRSPLGSVVNNVYSEVIAVGNEVTHGIFYSSHQSVNNGVVTSTWTARETSVARVYGDDGEVTFDCSSTNYCYANPKICVHFNLLYDSGD